MRQPKRMRSGFTLIELLVVIALIAVLIGMIAAAVFRVRAGQDITRTENDMQSIASGLNQQWQAAVDLAKKQGTPDIVRTQLAGQVPNRADAIWLKLNLIREFPQSPQEFLLAAQQFSAYGLTYHQHYANELIVPGGANPPQVYTSMTADKVGEESAVCLYLALTTSRGGVYFNPDNVGATSRGNVQLQDPNTGTKKSFSVFIDAWRKPIGFVRWTTDVQLQNELDLLVPPNTLASRRDREDPDGTLSAVWAQQGTVAQLLAPFGYTMPSQGASHNLTPFIYSAGRNGFYEFGANAADDILSFRFRKQGQRGN